MTGGICTATAAKLTGTVVYEVLSEMSRKSNVVRLGHPTGSLDFEISLSLSDNGSYRLDKAGATRTARRIMEGYVYVPREIVWELGEKE